MSDIDTEVSELEEWRKLIKNIEITSNGDGDHWEGRIKTDCLKDYFACDEYIHYKKELDDFRAKALDYVSREDDEFGIKGHEFKNFIKCLTEILRGNDPEFSEVERELMSQFSKLFAKNLRFMDEFKKIFDLKNDVRPDRAVVSYG